MTSEELLSRVLHRDASILVLDKPAGLPVHPGPKGGETLRDYLDLLRFGLKWRPELAHRLDRETSGCLVLGRHPQALARLSELFQRGEAKKTYLAIVKGDMPGDSGEIDMPLARKSPQRGWWMKPDPRGIPARTRWEIVTRRGDAALLRLYPMTGRTHQLRVHCAASGFPIEGDSIYGGAPRSTHPALMLHALRIELPYRPNKPPIRANAPIPAQMAARLAFLFGAIDSFTSDGDLNL